MLDEFFSDGLTPQRAKEEIQKLTFYPMMFQAARVLKTSGILKELYHMRKTGITSTEVATKLNLPFYGTNTLLEVGLSIGLVYFKKAERYTITKMGYFLLNDEATKVNLNFTHDVCYKALYHLEESIMTGLPFGLKELGFGEKPTIYPWLSQLEEPIRTSWFEFDHYYSDQAYPVALELVFKNQPKHIADIGGNTGRWSIECCKYDPDVKLTIVDLPGQWEKAKQNVVELNLADRISGVSIDVLKDDFNLPNDVDTVWMSQFLDCFSESQIVDILANINDAINIGTSIYILELYWDRQKDLAAAYCLHGTSLYFTAVANGNSKMYHSRDMYRAIESAGLKVVSDVDGVGEFHTLIECQKIN